MDRLTHVDESGAARMVDVSGKQVTARTAVASGRVLVSPRVVELLRGEGVPKGDALAVRLTGEVHRAEFGATGWLDMVGDVVRLDIVAEIRKAP